MSDAKIWVFTEQRSGKLAEVGLELLAKAREQAGGPGYKVAAVLLGHEIKGLTETLLAHGADEVLVADHPLLAEYCNEAYTKVLDAAVREAEPEIMLLGATSLGTDLGPRLAARLRTGLSAHCIDLEVTDAGELLAVVPGWGGSVMAKISCPVGRPQMATCMPGVFEPGEPGEPTGKITEIPAELSDADLSYQVLETVLEEPEASALDGAEVVVAGGWGVGDAATWKQLEELAAALGGAVGATRPPVDEGWATESQMIGTSGRTVSPKLYLGIACSGNAHHLVGLKNVGLSVGINTDPKSAIFENTDLGIVADVKEIVPALLKAIEEIKAG